MTALRSQSLTVTQGPSRLPEGRAAGAFDPKSHWDLVYAETDESDVSWYEETPEVSLELIAGVGATSTSAIIDVGGGAAHLAGALLDRGYADVAVLDVAQGALAKAKARLGERASRVQWIVADVTRWSPRRQYDVWHDRAAFHFLTASTDRAAYLDRLVRGVKPGGYAIIGTFGQDGPERCSGLPVAQYDVTALAAVLSPAFELVAARAHDHRTPAGLVQRFQFTTLRRLR